VRDMACVELVCAVICFKKIGCKLSHQQTQKSKPNHEKRGKGGRQDFFLFQSGEHDKQVRQWRRG
jgi:hypothetical protein